MFFFFKLKTLYVWKIPFLYNFKNAQLKLYKELLKINEHSEKKRGESKGG